ncbi:MAG: CotH kinase family protein, partial [Verrucomicrobia bacterium]|nr:CotH kinase family protein [Verrucomicrobiota bacterium]
PEVTGGYLVKIDRLGPGEDGFSAGGASMVYVEPKEPVITLPQRAAQRQYLHTFFNDFDRALHGPNWKDPALGYRTFIDVNSWIDFHVLEVLSGNVDSLALSTYLHKPRNGKIVFGPHWDFDRALGSTDGRDDNPRHWNTGPFFDVAWWPRLFSDPDFWQQWVDRWQELRQTHFSLTNLYGLTDRLTDELREAQPREVKRWGLHPRGGTFQSEIDLMKNWLSNRVDFIDRQLVQPPRLNHQASPVPPGFLLTLTGPTNATIYYTLDGSEPRLAQGPISSNALAYSGPIPLSNHIRLLARAHNPNQRQRGGPPSSTPWSGPVAATFIVTPP